MTNPAPNHWRRTERLDVRLSPFERTLLKTISRTFKGIVKLTLSERTYRVELTSFALIGRHRLPPARR